MAGMSLSCSTNTSTLWGRCYHQVIVDKPTSVGEMISRCRKHFAIVRDISSSVAGVTSPTWADVIIWCRDNFTIMGELSSSGAGMTSLLWERYHHRVQKQLNYYGVDVIIRYIIIMGSMSPSGARMNSLLWEGCHHQVQG